MSMPTKFPPVHADRAAIFRLSWHGFLVCAFAIMTLLGLATLRQALSEPNATAPHGSRIIPAPAGEPGSNGGRFVNAD
jgi:hypothetical protein